MTEKITNTKAERLSASAVELALQGIEDRVKLKAGFISGRWAGGRDFHNAIKKIRECLNAAEEIAAHIPQEED